MNAPHHIDPSQLAGKLRRIRAEVDAGDALELLRRSHACFGEQLVVACSFGPEDMVLLELLAQLRAETGDAPRVFTLDTGRLHEETYAVMEEARTRYDLEFDVFAPDAGALEALLGKSGPLSFYESVEARRGCCAVRKVEPLGRALRGATAWVTGLRRAQAVTRTVLERVEIDEGNGGLFKLNPLADWSEFDVWSFVDDHQLPTNRLHDQGFASIGCAPCTRAVEGWERGRDNSAIDIRAGRWWWESADHKECGLHAGTPLPVVQAGSGDES